MEADPANDHLSYANDYTVKNNIIRDETLLYSEKVHKKHKKLGIYMNQERSLVITNKAVYNIVPKSKGNLLKII